MRDSIQREYQLLADARDRAAALCCAYVLEKLWDQAAGEAKRWSALQEQCEALIEGRPVRRDTGPENGGKLRSVE